MINAIDSSRVIADAIRNLVRALRLTASEAERHHEISAAQMFVLKTVSASEGLSLGELARRTAADQSSVSVVVRKLDEAGLLERNRAADDSRRLELRLTSRGRTIADSSDTTAQERLLDAIRSLPERDRTQLARILPRLASALGRSLENPPMFFEDGE